jgi:hypothetical protein
MATLHEDQCTFVILCRWILRMRNVLDKSCRENSKRMFLLNSFFFFLRKSCPLWYNVEKYGRVGQATDYNIIWRRCFACWITKATNNHSEYVIFIAFVRQKWLRHRASVIPYAYSASPVALPTVLLVVLSLRKFAQLSDILLMRDLELCTTSYCPLQTETARVTTLMTERYQISLSSCGTWTGEEKKKAKFIVI